MKIIQVVSHFPDVIGGHEFYLSKFLAEAGNEVHVFASNKYPRGYTSIRKNEKEGKIMKEGIHVYRLPIYFEYYDVPIIKNLEKALISETSDADIIHAHEDFQICSLVASGIATRKNIPFVLTEHVYEPPHNHFLYIPYTLVRKTIGKVISYRANRIIALTDDASKHLMENGVKINKIVKIPTGIDIERFKIVKNPPYYLRSKEKEGIYILFVGRLVQNKGVLQLLDAFARLNKEISDTFLVLIGQGGLRKKLMDRIKMYRVGDKVIHLEFVPQAKMPLVHQDCDIFVLPTIFYEPFGIAALEAMASGLPVIGSKLGGIKETIVDGQTGFLINPGNSREIYEKLKTLVLNDSLRKNMGAKGRIRAVEKYSWRIIAKKTISVYKNCTSL